MQVNRYGSWKQQAETPCRKESGMPGGKRPEKETARSTNLLLHEPDFVVHLARLRCGPRHDCSPALGGSRQGNRALQHHLEVGRMAVWCVWDCARNAGKIREKGLNVVSVCVGCDYNPLRLQPQHHLLYDPSESGVKLTWPGVMSPTCPGRQARHMHLGWE